MTAYHTNRCFSSLNAAKDWRKANCKAVWLLISSVPLHNFESYPSSSEVNYKKGWAIPIWPHLCYYCCNHMELNSWLRSLHERCSKHWIDSQRKFQDHLQTQGSKINLNDDYNKNIFIMATTKIIMNKNIFMYTYSNTQSLNHPVPPTSEVDATSTSSIISLIQSDS